jgi:hypothetical protein
VSLGKRRRLSRSRSLPRDVLHFFNKCPTAPQDRVVDVSRLLAVQERFGRPFSWPLLFLKAFALVAAKHPELRQSYRGFPWPHVLQEDRNVAMLVVQRRFRDEWWVLWGQFESPENQSLELLQAQLDNYAHGPVETTFRRQVQLAGLPTPLRRVLWWWTLEVSRKRAKRVGTYFLTTLAGQDCTIQHPANFLNSLTYGPFDDAGRTRLTLAYDHRLMDGLLVARALKATEKALNGTILDELTALAERRDGAGDEGPRSNTTDDDATTDAA